MWNKKKDVGYVYMCIHTMEYYLDIKKKNEIMPSSATGIDLEILILNEVSQTKSNIILYHLYVESKKMQINLFIKEKETTDIENKHGYQRG